MAFSERYCDAAAGSNLNGGFPIGGAYPVTSTNGAYTQGGGAGGTDRFTAAAGTPFSGCAAGDLVSSYADGASAPTGFVGRVTAVNGGGASLDISLTAISGTRPTTGASGRTATVGGAWKGPNAASGFPMGFITSALTNAAGDQIRINLKNGTNYAVAAASGATVMTASSAGPLTWEGYTTTAGDGGFAVIDGTGGTAGAVFKVLVISGTAQAWKHLHFNGNFAGSPTGGDANGNNMVDATATNQYFFRCKFTNAWRMGLQINGTGGSGGSLVEECAAFECNHDSAEAFAGFGSAEECQFINCLSAFNGVNDDANGFYCNASAGEPILILNCISAFNWGSGIRQAGAGPLTIRNCVIWDSGADGFETTAAGSGSVNFTNNIVGESTEWGIAFNVALQGASYNFRNNAFFSNTSGDTTNLNTSFISGSITLTGDPFTDAANGDFSLNNTAGAGAACREAGIGAFLSDTTWFSETTTSFPSLGAAEPDAAAPAGGQTSYTFG